MKNLSYCSNCGAEVPEGNNFCPECGANISEEEAGRESERTPERGGGKEGDETPTGGFILSLIAGILILINGGIIAAIGSMFLAFLPVASVVIAAAGLIFGIVVIIGAILLYKGKTMIGGILVILFSLFSLSIGGGFIIGFILGLVGGILGIAKS